MAKRKERQFDPNSIRRVVANIEWSDGELFPRIGFIVTNSWLPAGKAVKVGARIAYHASKWYVHVASAFSLARYCQVALGLRAVRIFSLTESHMARYAQECVNKTLFVDATMVLPCCCLAARDHQSSHWAPDGRCQDRILGQTYL